MNYTQLTYTEILLTIEKIADDYSAHIDYDCVEEITDKFYDEWDGTFTGVSKDEAYMFNSMLEAMVKNYITKVLEVSE